MHLFLVDVTPLENSALFAHCLALLSSWRKAKVLALRRPEDQRRSLGAGLLLRHGLAALGVTEEEAGAGQDARGKPCCLRCPHLHFSLSHSGSWALGGFAAGFPVGVDVEKITSVDFLPLSELFFHPREHGRLLHEDPADRARLFFRLWTRRECCLKAVGSGLAVNPASFSALPEDGDAPDSLLLNGRRWHVREYPVEGDYALAVCAGSAALPEAPVPLHPARMG